MNSKNTGTTFLSILTLIFITLKLLDKIDWSWWWVLSPILIPVGCALIILGLFGMGYLLVIIYKKYKR